MSLTQEPDLDDQQLVRYLLGLLPDEEAERLDESQRSSTTRSPGGCGASKTTSSTPTSAARLPRRDAGAIRILLSLVAASPRAGTVRGELARARSTDRRRPRPARPRHRAAAPQRGASRVLRAALRLAGIGPGAARRWCPHPARCCSGTSGSRARSTAARTEMPRSTRRLAELERRPSSRRRSQPSDARQGTGRRPAVAAAARPLQRCGRRPIGCRRSRSSCCRRRERVGPDRHARRAAGRRPRARSSCGSSRTISPATRFDCWRIRPPTRSCGAAAGRGDVLRHADGLGPVVPASLLKPQHYSLESRRADAAGHTEVVGSYAFQIVPR